MGLVDQALFRRVIYPADDRLEHWLRAAESRSDPYLQEAAHRIRESMAQWPLESRPEQPSYTPRNPRPELQP